MTRFEIIQAIAHERDRQVKLGWSGRHDTEHSDSAWLALLTKQLADLSMSVNFDGNGQTARDGCIQLISVAVAWLEAQQP